MATFRCIPNPKVLYTPEFEHDVIAMRKHPEYEEVDAEGNVIKQPEDGVQRPLISVTDKLTLAPGKPARGKRK